MDEFDIEKQTEPPADYVDWTLNNFKVEDVTENTILCNLEPWETVSCGATSAMPHEISNSELDIKMERPEEPPNKLDQVDQEPVISEELSPVDLGHICEIVGTKDDPQESKQYICLYCGLQLSWNHLRFHMKFGHNNHDKVKLCKRFDCEFHTKNRTEADIEMAAVRLPPEPKETNGVDNSEVHKCTMCDFTTKKKSNLREHVKYTHSKEEDVELHKCLICGFTTKYKYGLKKHAKKHSELTLHKCPFCEYSTIMPLLLEHIKFKHSDEQNSEEASVPIQ